jgi:hypothetical protein
MIRIGFGITNINVGFGPDLNLEAIIQVIRTAIGIDIMHEGDHHDRDHHDKDGDQH